MSLPNITANNLISKDKEKSQKAAFEILNKPDIEAWKCLIENSDYLFSFILQKAGEKIARQINNENLEKVFKLFKYYAPVFDDYIVEALLKFRDESLDDEILYLLKEGTPEEKTYAAKYAGKAYLDVASDLLFLNSKEEYSPLKITSAEALGKIKDQNSYEYYLSNLNLEDDWEKLEAAQFLALYGDKNAVISILKSMTNSAMAEHMAGEAANLAKLHEYFYVEDQEIKELALEAYDNILNGISEIWSLGALFDFKIYECVEALINLAKNDTESDFFSKYAQLLLKTKQKISMFVENSQYTFDEEKDVINELSEINGLLAHLPEDFWQLQSDSVVYELKSLNDKRKLAAISIIEDIKIQEAMSYLLDLIYNSNENDIVRVEAILTLIKLGYKEKIENIEDVVSSISSDNMQAIVKMHI